MTAWTQAALQRQCPAPFRVAVLQGSGHVALRPPAIRAVHRHVLPASSHPVHLATASCDWLPATCQGLLGLGQHAPGQHTASDHADPAEGATGVHGRLHHSRHELQRTDPETKPGLLQVHATADISMYCNNTTLGMLRPALEQLSQDPLVTLKPAGSHRWSTAQLPACICMLHGGHCSV